VDGLAVTGTRTWIAFALAATAGLLTACGNGALEGTDFSGAQPADQFLGGLQQYCGQAFEGRVTSDTGEGAGTITGGPLVMHVRECTESEIRIPFHVGDDRSRTWILTRTSDGLRLKHDHRHEDGSPDAVTMYGGDTLGAEYGTAVRQEFPADQESRDLFVREGLDVSVNNVWALEHHPDGVFTYELARPQRLFRVEFDLTRPVEPPPPPWGAD
jgi:hypothetical protein